jgi:hypothetical protein
VGLRSDAIEGATLALVLPTVRIEVGTLLLAAAAAGTGTAASLARTAGADLTGPSPEGADLAGTGLAGAVFETAGLAGTAALALTTGTGGTTEACGFTLEASTLAAGAAGGVTGLLAAGFTTGLAAGLATGLGAGFVGALAVTTGLATAALALGLVGILAAGLTAALTGGLGEDLAGSGFLAPVFAPLAASFPAAFDATGADLPLDLACAACGLGSRASVERAGSSLAACAPKPIICSIETIISLPAPEEFSPAVNLLNPALNQTLLKTLHQDVFWQIYANKHHLAKPLFARRPLWAQVTAH